MTATETYGPFDGAPWADQTQWYRFAPAWSPSGVIDLPATSPSAGGLGVTFSGLTPTLAIGRAWARGAGYEISGTSKTMSAAAANTNASLYRRDRIVLRRDLAAKTVAPVLLQGTPASTPVAPAVQSVETGQYDSLLFSFLVPPNSGTTITGIVDERVWLSPDGVDGTSGVLSLVGGWDVVSGYHAPTWYLSSDGWVTLSGATLRTAANFALGTGTLFQFANVPAAIAPSAKASPGTGWVLVGSTTAQVFPCRIHVEPGSSYISVIGMDSGTGTVVSGVGIVNFDGVRWHI